MTDLTLESRLRPRKEPRQRRAEQTRARILDAARAVFAERGYAGGTTNHIADAAALSVGSLYQYFPNKDAILVELVDEHVTDGALRLAEIMPTEEEVTRPGGLEAAIRRVVTTMVDVHTDDRRLHRVLFEESPRPPALLDRLRDLESAVTVIVARLLDAAGAGGDDPVLRARIAIVAIESSVHRLITAEDGLDPDTVTDEVTRLVVGYLS